MLRVSNYTPERKSDWDAFAERSKNGVFLFRRDYMEYHADRFTDFSLLIEDDRGRLAAVVPASIKDDVVTSHAGLTFGGVVSDERMKVETMLDLFGALGEHLKRCGVAKLVYKVVPHIYHRLPAEEDLYALFRSGARLTRRDVSAAIDTARPLPFSTLRARQIRRASREGVEVARSSDFETFMSIHERVLAERHGARPVHTASEIAMLAARFPDNIKLFAAARGGRMVAGVVVYESRMVAHAQYIAADPEGAKTGASDLIMGTLINDYYAAKPYFDFGISTEEGGRLLNGGLAGNKEGFGARAVVYDFYELTV
jgi:Acetyltransferase (GNAT) domain